MSEALVLEQFTGTTLRYHDLDLPTATSVQNTGVPDSRYVTLGPKEFHWTSAMAEQALANWSFATPRANQLRLIFWVSAIEQPVSTSWSKQFLKEFQLRLFDSHFPPAVFDGVRTEIIRDANIEFSFKDLAKRWRDETINLSFSHQRTEHEAYKKIIALGWPVVPFILDDLRKRPSLWFDALTAITGDDPILDHPETYGDVKAMSQCWIDWGKQKGL
jgi:hypothetical protein